MVMAKGFLTGQGTRHNALVTAAGLPVKNADVLLYLISLNVEGSITTTLGWSLYQKLGHCTTASTGGDAV